MNEFNDMRSKISKVFIDDQGCLVTVWPDTSKSKFKALVQKKRGEWVEINELPWKSSEKDACFILEVYAAAMGWAEVKPEWKVTCNPIEDKRFYRVYRLCDVIEIDHSGNREYAGEYTLDKQAAVGLAAALNNAAE